MEMEYMSEYSMDEMENIHFVVVEIHIKTDKIIHICGKSSQNVYGFTGVNMV